MAETISRSLRDGCLEGEHAPALNLKDSLQSPLGSYAFNHFLSALISDISSSKSQACGLVLVAFARSPSFYFDLIKGKGFDVHLVRILDCYSDPLGWKDRSLKLGSNKYEEIKELVTVSSDVKDTKKLQSSILDIGQVFAKDGKVRFAVSIDSASTLLRHASVPSISRLIGNLRSHGQVSCIFWLIHADLHEPRASAAVEYISTMVASLQPMIQSTEGLKNPDNLFWLDQNSHQGKFQVRLKRRNGRVKILCEEFHMEQDGMKFTAVSSENMMVNQNLVPKVLFNLQLSEKEKADRARVVLPFEHQGNGETIEIYDGRRSFAEGNKDPHSVQHLNGNNETNNGAGEIHYVRDSDDEAPDSDEDPDDDLDI